MSAERFPLDFDALNRGDVIPAERIESIYNVTRREATYRLKMMHLAEQIESHFRVARAEELLVKHDGDTLKLLTHPEQAEESQRRAVAMVRGYGRALMKAVGVDLSKLDDAARNRHERHCHVAAFRLQQLRKAQPPELSNEPKQVTK